MTIIDHLQWRYATKKFNPYKRLSSKKIETLKEAFNLTATSFGLQTITMLVIADKEVRKPLVEHSFNQNQVYEASHLLILCIQDNISDQDVETFFENIKDQRHTPDHILEPYKLDLITMMRNMSIEERQNWSIKQAYIALGNLMTVCAVERVDSCPMEGFSAAEYDTILNLKSRNLKSTLLLPVGYRADDDMFAEFKKVRKTVAECTIEL
jgi:nitroreductase